MDDQSLLATFGPIALALALPTALYAVIRPTHRVFALRIGGAVLATLGFFAAILMNATGCTPFFFAIFVGPIIAIVAADGARRLPQIRTVNVILTALFLLAPLAGLALGHGIHAGPGDCP